MRKQTIVFILLFTSILSPLSIASMHTQTITPVLTVMNPSEGIVGEVYTFTVETPDEFENEPYTVRWSFGDGITALTGPYNAGETAQAFHWWSKPGLYQVQVQFIDRNGVESDWVPVVEITIFLTRIEIQAIDDGILAGVVARLSNTGFRDAENISWTITLRNATVLIPLSGKKTGLIDRFLFEENRTIMTGPVFGFSSPIKNAEITIDVTGAQIQSVEQARSARLFLFFINVKR